MSEETTLNTTILDEFARILTQKQPTGKVGILADAGAALHGGTDKNNATIGLYHEYGNPETHLPERSFLRLPLISQLEKKFKSESPINKDTFKMVLEQKSMRPIVERMGIFLEGIVIDAFVTNGYGMWKALKPATLAKKTRKETLIETQQLQRSITSSVED